jgi:hypothetical protein
MRIGKLKTSSCQHLVKDGGLSLVKEGGLSTQKEEPGQSTQLMSFPFFRLEHPPSSDLGY